MNKAKVIAKYVESRMGDLDGHMRAMRHTYAR